MARVNYELLGLKSADFSLDRNKRKLTKQARRSPRKKAKRAKTPKNTLTKPNLEEIANLYKESDC